MDPGADAGPPFRSASREVSGDFAYFKRGIGIVGEHGGRMPGLAANPCLYRIETIRRLMNVVEIRDVVERAEQLDQTIAAIANTVGRGHNKVSGFQSRALAARTEITEHHNSPVPSTTNVNSAKIGQ